MFINEILTQQRYPGQPPEALHNCGKELHHSHIWQERKIGTIR